MFLEIYNPFRMEMNSGTILGYFLQAVPITIVVGILYAVCRLVFLKQRNGNIAWMSETMRLPVLYSAAALVAYVGCALVYLLIIRKAVLGQISIGDTAMFLTACLSFQVGLTELFDGICSLPAQLGILQNYRSFMEELTEGTEKEGTGRAGSDPSAAAGHDAVVKVEDLSFAYPDTQRNVLNHVCFEIKRGECVALVGINGAGKTTLARLLAGFYDCYQGSIVVAGKEAAAAEECEGLAIMFQNYLKPSMTVGEAIAYGGSIPGMKRLSGARWSSAAIRCRTFRKGLPQA